jgi:sucrose-6-phosphate hydrolase SacC (GH32 family)
MLFRSAALIATLAIVGSASATTTCTAASGNNPGPCRPGREQCGPSFSKTLNPSYHLIDQQGCGENDPNSPVFDPVHGVIHHFYQIHVSTPEGGGPNYGHFVSKDFINWAPLPTAIWNGLDSSTTPFTPTKYDTRAIWSGSAQVFDGAGPGGKGPGMVTIYPGLCDKQHWPACGTGYVLAQAVPADYAGDQLLTNWTKPSYNPVMENATRDPSSPWKTPSGSWRVTDLDSSVFEAASDAAVLAGQWNNLGRNKDFRFGPFTYCYGNGTCKGNQTNWGAECPSFYPLPAATPGTEAAYQGAQAGGGLPTHVRKTSTGGDWWQAGTYDAGKVGTLGTLTPTPGWEDLWPIKSIDTGNFYASKDNSFPTLQKGVTRRINWGWAVLGGGAVNCQTLPREITFNAATRALQQYPIEELEALRGEPVSSSAAGTVPLPPGTANCSEIVVAFTLPTAAATLGVTVTAPNALNSTNCSVDYVPGATKLNVSCRTQGDLPDQGLVKGSLVKGSVPMLPSETSFEIRIFSDATLLEVFFQRGRAVMTVAATMSAATQLVVHAAAAPAAAAAVGTIGINATAWPMRGIWVTSDAVREAPRVYA